jgi:predicted metal-binding membrane protein
MAYRVETQMRAILLTTIALLTCASWLITYYQVANMGLLMRLGVPMSLGMEGWADLTSLVVFSGMWLAMMLAMMLPSSYPTLLLHRTVSRKRTPAARWSTVCFGSGYFFIWSATGFIFYLAYVAIGDYRHTGYGDQLLLRGAGGTVAIAGLYQWSRLKETCLRHCQSPLHFVMNHWRDGRAGAFQMGAEHGLYCFGCCWA